MDMIERVARAIKSEIGEQWDAQPLPGANNPEDWSATGGTLDLITVARAAIEAITAEFLSDAEWEEARKFLRTDSRANLDMALAAIFDRALNKQGGR
jgi:hypothetical protein